VLPDASAIAGKHQGDRIARREGLFERLVEQPINIVLKLTVMIRNSRFRIAPGGLRLFAAGGNCFWS